MTGVYDILEAVKNGGRNDPVWKEKMTHPVPDVEVVERVKFLLGRCKDKTVLDIGCASGQLFSEIAKTAFKAYGIDQDETPFPTTAVYDLDSYGRGEIIPWADKPIEVVTCGEILEHLSNPGILLDMLAATHRNAEVIITVPNAFSDGARNSMSKGIESVNRDHVCWFSWHTLKILVERSGYEVREWHWYNGRKKFSEGLVFVCQQPACLHERLNDHGDACLDCGASRVGADWS